MEKEVVAFYGGQKGLLEKVETGEMIPKFQTSHAPMCKFMTAFFVLNGIRHYVPLAHAPTGCALQVSEWIRRSNCCELRGGHLLSLSLVPNLMRAISFMNGH